MCTPQVLHAGEPVTRGVRDILVGFVTCAGAGVVNEIFSDGIWGDTFQASLVPGVEQLRRDHRAGIADYEVPLARPGGGPSSGSRRG